jgi:hypothetical protein
MDQSNPFELYSGNGPNGDLRKFSDELKEKYLGKVLEIYIGDQYETLNFDDYSTPQNCIIYGRLVEVLDRFLVVNCFYIDKTTGVLRDDNTCYISSFQIRAMTPLDARGTLGDIFLSTNDGKKIHDMLTGKRPMKPMKKR